MKRIAFSLFLSLLACGAYASDCIPSGTVDQYTYFVAVDSTDFTTRETGLSSFTVYRSRDGGTAAAFTTPTINETDATNMPGVYELLLDEDMTIASGNDVEHMSVHITATGMAPVTKEFCIARAKITAGETLTVSSGTGNSAVQSIAANAITATAIATDAITAAKIAADAIGASEIAASAIGASELATDAIGSDEWAATATSEVQSGLATAANLAIVDGVVDNILLDTAEIGTAGAGLTEAGGTGDQLTAVPWNAAWDAEVESEVDDSIGGGTGTSLTAIPWNASWDTEVQSEANDALVALDLDDLAKSQHTTTIATLASQTSFTLTAGSADADAYNGWEILVIDASTATQVAAGVVEDYAVTTRTVTLMVDPGVFTMAVGDTVILRPANANVRQMNGYEVTGDGTTGTEWSGTGDGGL